MNKRDLLRQKKVVSKQYNETEFEGKSVFELSKLLLTDIPSEFQATAIVTIDTDADRYEYSSVSVSLNVTYTREETDEEYGARIAAIKEYEQRLKDNKKNAANAEKALFLRLQKKYGKKRHG